LVNDLGVCSINGSLSDFKKQSIVNILKNYDNINTLILAFDDDEVGRKYEKEIIELLKENGYKNLTGVDINKEMLNEIKYKEIKIFIEDAITFLKQQPSNNAGIISSFHMIEHINFNDLLTIIKESFRVLDKNGILILETPNPENIKVSSENFYLDYSHIKPIPMELLKFAVEYFGFNAKILRLHKNKVGNSIKDIFYEVSPDYAVIGFKNKKMIDEKFFQQGVSLDLTLFAFEERLKNLEERMKNMELKVENEKLKNQNQALLNENNHLKEEIQNIKKLYEEVINSKSWKITEPLRKAINFLRKKKREKILQITTNEKDLELSPRAKEIYKKLKEKNDIN
jgi:SAM-dependent methyltransferase